MLPIKLVPAGITGTGIYLPQRIVTNVELEKFVDTSDEWIRTRTGISERRFIDDNMATSDMAVKAAEMALQSAGVSALDVDLIVLATISPDMSFPATSCLVQDKLGATNAAAFDLSAGCAGFVYALGVGSKFVETGMYKTVLVIGADCLSKVLNWEDRASCVLFGDGAGAIVLQPVEQGSGILSFDLGADGSGSELLKQEIGGSRKPYTAENCQSSEKFLYMAGAEVFKFAVRAMAESASQAMQKAGLDKSEISCFVPHQANARIIDSAAKKLGLPAEKVFLNVHKYGNTSGASIPIALHEATLEGKIKKGDYIVIVGFGTGLTWGASVIKWSI